MRTCLFLCLLFIAPLAIADTLQMVDTPDANITIPTRGMDMVAVKAQWGAPLEKRTPVGEPPITRWVYKNFIVYFEYDKVIHSVLAK